MERQPLLQLQKAAALIMIYDGLSWQVIVPTIYDQILSEIELG